MCRFIETVRIKDGVAENLSAHNARMNATRRACFPGKPCAELEDLNLEDYISPSGFSGLTRCRVVYSCGIERVEYFPYAMRSVRTLKLVEDNDAEYQFKSEDRSVIDRNFALRGEADDVLIVRNGMLTDTSIANIALHRDRTWYTPRLPLLKGTRRQLLLDEGLIVEDDISPCMLHEYDRLRIFNAMIHFGELELEVSEAILQRV